MNNIQDVIDTLNLIGEDDSVPRNIRTKVKDALVILNEEEKPIDVRCDKVIQELDNLSDDPNMESYIRTQIWNVMSTLESR